MTSELFRYIKALQGGMPWGVLDAGTGSLGWVGVAGNSALDGHERG